jgi:hypothetical protein
MYRSSRDAHHYRSIGDIADNDGTHPDDHTFTDANTLAHAGTGSNMAESTDLHSTG